MFSVSVKRSIALSLTLIMTFGAVFKYSRRDVQAAFVVDDVAIAALVVTAITGLLAIWGINSVNGSTTKTDVASDFWDWLCVNHEDTAKSIYKRSSSNYSDFYKSYTAYANGEISAEDYTSLAISAASFRALSIYFKQWANYTTEGQKYFVRDIVTFVTSSTAYDNFVYELNGFCSDHSNTYSEAYYNTYHSGCVFGGNSLKTKNSTTSVKEGVYKVYKVYNPYAQFSTYAVSDGRTSSSDGSLLYYTANLSEWTSEDIKYYGYIFDLTSLYGTWNKYKYENIGAITVSSEVTEDVFDGEIIDTPGLTLADENLLVSDDADEYAQNYLTTGDLVIDGNVGDTDSDTDSDSEKSVGLPIPLDFGDYENALQNVKEKTGVIDNAKDDPKDDANDDANTGENVDSANPTDTVDPADTANPTDSADSSNPSKYKILDDLSGKFPFCIPFDLANFVGILSSDPITPKFDWTFSVPSLNISVPISLDLSNFDDLASVVRRFELLIFCVGLIIITRSLIRS